MSFIGSLSQQEFRALPLDARIRIAAADVLGWRYVTGNGVRFPTDREGLPSSLVDPAGGGIDCSSFTAYVLTTVFPDGKWDRDRYAELQIMDAAQPWSPIDAIERAYVGSRVDAPVGGAWHLTQTWKSLSPLSGGHARLSYAMPGDPNQLLVLESTNANNKVGPRWSRTTWSKLAAYGGGAKAAALGAG